MYYVEIPAIASIIDVMKTTVWGESGFPARLLEYLTSYKPIIGDYLRYTPFPARASFGDKVRRKIRTKAIQIQKFKKMPYTGQV